MGTERVTVHLMPKVNYSPQMRRIVGGLLEQVNQQGPVLPDGSKRKLRFRLAHKSELQLAIQPASTAAEPTAENGQMRREHEAGRWPTLPCAVPNSGGISGESNLRVFPSQNAVFTEF